MLFNSTLTVRRSSWTWFAIRITVDVNAQIANMLRRYDVVRAYGQWAAGNQLLLSDQTESIS